MIVKDALLINNLALLFLCFTLELVRIVVALDFSVRDFRRLWVFFGRVVVCKGEVGERGDKGAIEEEL